MHREYRDPRTWGRGSFRRNIGAEPGRSAGASWDGRGVMKGDSDAAGVVHPSGRSCAWRCPAPPSDVSPEIAPNPGQSRILPSSPSRAGPISLREPAGLDGKWIQRVGCGTKMDKFGRAEQTESKARPDQQSAGRQALVRGARGNERRGRRQRAPAVMSSVCWAPEANSVTARSIRR